MEGRPPRAHLVTHVQDRDYLLKTAERLYSIAAGVQGDFIAGNQTIGRTDAYFRILAWEIGLHEMFWDALGEDGIVLVHPTLGRGTVVKKEVKPIQRDDYVAKLIHIKFDCGQSCVFHSRVAHNEKVSEKSGKRSFLGIAVTKEDKEWRTMRKSAMRPVGFVHMIDRCCLACGRLKAQIVINL